MKRKLFLVGGFALAIAGAFGSKAATKVFAFGPYFYTDAAGVCQQINTNVSCEGANAVCTIITAGLTTRQLHKTNCSGALARKQ